MPSADQVDLVGTVTDLFPGLEPASTPTAGQVNEFAIYNYNTKPVLFQVSTQKAIGITEDQYTAPSSPPAGNFPYPEDMYLAVYETAPFVSPLEIFYESSTSELVSDLNESLVNENTNITGISSFTSSFPESAQVGTIITTDFFPTAGGVNVVTASLSSYTVYNYFDQSPDTGTLDTTVLQNSKFNIEAGSSVGSFRIVTADRFYAGSSAEAGFFVDWRGKYQFNLTFVQEDGVTSTQTLEIDLENVAPVIDRINVSAVVTTQFVDIVKRAATGTIVESNKGRNGSAKAFSLGDTTGLTGSTFELNPPNGNAWEVDKITITDLTTTATTEIPDNGESISDYIQVASGTTKSVTIQSVIPNTDYLTFDLKGALNSTGGQANGPMNTSNKSYLINLRLTDTLGLTNTSATISYNVDASYFFGKVIATPYLSGIDPTGRVTNGNASDISDNTLQNPSQGNAPRWTGQIQNWTSNTVYLYVQVTIGSAQQQTGQAQAVNVRGVYGNNTTSFTDSQGTSFTLNADGAVQSVVVSNGTQGNSSTLNQFAVLSPFTAASAGVSQTNFDNAVTAGMRPGGKGDGTYNSPDCSGSSMIGGGVKLQSQGGSYANNVYAAIIASTQPQSAGQSAILNASFGIVYEAPISPPWYEPSGNTDASINPTVVPVPVTT